MKSFILIVLSLTILQSCIGEKHTKYKKVEPAHLVTAEDGRITVILTPKAYERLGIQSVSVPQKDGAMIISSSALIFDNHGKVWVYAQKEDFSFYREEVILHKVQRDQASVTFRNQKNHLIVVSGSAELYGTEAGVGK